MTRVVVVGGGTAGCVLAARLSAEPGNDVTLLEAGTADGPRASVASTLADLAVTGATWPGSYLRGRGLGGSSRVNGALLSGHVPAGLPVDVVGEDELGPVDRAVLAAGGERVSLLRRDGRVLSTAEVFLEPARGRSNLHVALGAAADRVEFDDKRVVGVTLVDRSQMAVDRVVLCAGTIGSAALLLRSGVAGRQLGRFTDHAARVIDLELSVDVDSASLVTGAVLRRDGVELVALNHIGAGVPRRGALIAGWLGTPRWGSVDAGGGVTFEPLDVETAAGLQRAVDTALAMLTGDAFGGLVVAHSLSSEVGGYFHAAGSCRSVVDSAGAVSGYSGLHIVDASVISLPPHGPLASVLDVAHRWSL